MASKSVSVEMPVVSEKKSVTRFDATASDAAISNVYVSKAALSALGDTSKGVRVTIEAL